MFTSLLLVNLLLLPGLVDSNCYSKSPQVWICNSTSRPTTQFDYQTVLTSPQLEKFFLRNYRLSELKIDDYSPTLRLLNASNNQFETVILTSKHRYTSVLRQLTLQSNNIQRLNTDTFVVPLSVEIISLANNRLEILDARIFSHLKNLTKLDLRNNYLKRILPLLVLNINVLLKNNPLECQCTPEFYRIVCEKSTNLKQSVDNNNCLAPYFSSHLASTHSLPYLRFSTIILTCPIAAQPPPVIVWSTPFGTLSSANSSHIDLFSSPNDKPIYVVLIASAGPFTARTRHTIHASDANQLTITEARAGLRHYISCSGINMLGTYTYEFDFDIDPYGEKHALWNIIYTMGFGFFMALVAGALCVSIKRTSYYSKDHLRTPPVYPTMTANSAARTPPNFELNQWLLVAAANISGTLEQVRDRLRSGVQHVSEHMGQTMGRASELFTYSVQHAGGTIRHAAETSAAYLHSFRETSQQRLNTMRVQTVSSLRNPGNLMRAGMNMLTTQVNSLRDYCGVTTGQTIPANYLIQQQLHQTQHSPGVMSYIHPHSHMLPIMEDDESLIESTALICPTNPTPYVGHTSAVLLANASGIGQLDAANSSALIALNNFNHDQNCDAAMDGQMTSGIGTFHDQVDELISEPERLTIYGAQRPVC